MREVKVTALVDTCRDALGATEVHGWIQAGHKDGLFWAEEGGHTVGVKPGVSPERMNIVD